MLSVSPPVTLHKPIIHFMIDYEGIITYMQTFSIFVSEIISRALI